MRKLLFLLALLPALAHAQYYGGYLSKSGGTLTGNLGVTGNVSVQGNLSSTSNLQQAGPTNSGVAIGGGPNYAITSFYDQTKTADNRTAQEIFISGGQAFRFTKDDGSAATSWLTGTGGYGTGITGITSNSGSGTWAHTGSFSATGNVQGFNVVANNGSLYAGGAASTPLNVTTQSSVQAFIGGASNQATVAYINSTLSANNRAAYSQWQGSVFAIAAFANDAFNAGIPIITATGGFSSGITGIASNSGTGAWAHTGNMTVTGNLSATGTGTMPVYGNTGTAFTNQHAVTGYVALTAGAATVTLSGAAVYTSATTYTCTANDTTAANAVKVTPSSGTSIAFTGSASTTDTIAYQCVGN